MNKKRILIVCRNFYPVISPRAYRATELAKEFARQGHDITVCFPVEGRDYSAYANSNNLKIINLGELRWKGVVLKGGKFEFMVRRAVRRGLQLLFDYPDIELMFLVYKKLAEIHAYDLLISIAVPHTIHWGVAKARTEKRKISDCWVADCGDPYMGEKTDSFRRFYYFKYIEKWFCRKADFITVPISEARSAYYTEFHDKIRVIPQGFQIDNLKIPIYKKLFDYPVFGYAGGFIPGKRDPSDLLNFLSAYKRKFKFIVYTSHLSLLMPYKEALGDKLEIREKIAREELIIILSGMDFLINFDNNTKVQLPSKLIDYAMAGRPVLNITSDSDFSYLLEFMNGNYIHTMKLPPLDSYDIGVVAKAFTSLRVN